MCKSFGPNLAEKGPKIALAAAKRGRRPKAEITKRRKSPNGDKSSHE
jgi:hypothetical protein